MPQAQLPDGTILDFPEGTDPAVMQRAVKARLGIGTKPDLAVRSGAIAAAPEVKMKPEPATPGVASDVQLPGEPGDAAAFNLVNDLVTGAGKSAGRTVTNLGEFFYRLAHPRGRTQENPTDAGSFQTVRDELAPASKAEHVGGIVEQGVEAGTVGGAVARATKGASLPLRALAQGEGQFLTGKAQGQSNLGAGVGAGIAAAGPLTAAGIKAALARWPIKATEEGALDAMRRAVYNGGGERALEVKASGGPQFLLDKKLWGGARGMREKIQPYIEASNEVNEALYAKHAGKPIPTEGILRDIETARADQALTSNVPSHAMVETSTGFKVVRSPGLTSTSVGLHGPNGEKIGLSEQAGRINWVTIGKGEGNGLDALKALREYASKVNKSVYVADPAHLSADGQRMFEIGLKRGAIIKTPEGYVVNGTQPGSVSLSSGGELVELPPAVRDSAAMGAANRAKSQVERATFGPENVEGMPEGTMSIEALRDLKKSAFQAGNLASTYGQKPAEKVNEAVGASLLNELSNVDPNFGVVGEHLRTLIALDRFLNLRSVGSGGEPTLITGISSGFRPFVRVGEALTGPGPMSVVALGRQAIAKAIAAGDIDAATQLFAILSGDWAGDSLTSSEVSANRISEARRRAATNALIRQRQSASASH